MSRFFRHRGLKLIEVSISMVSAIRLSFTAKLIMEKMKIIDELAGLRDCFKLFDFTRHHLRDGVHP